MTDAWTVTGKNLNYGKENRGWICILVWGIPVKRVGFVLRPGEDVWATGQK